MSPRTTHPPLINVVQRVRCHCGACGAHVMVRPSWQLAGQCGTCGSYDLQPLVASVVACRVVGLAEVA